MRAMRIERPGHDLLHRLPRAWSRDAEAADFSQRFLAPPEAELADLLDRAERRHLLIDPRTAPAEALDWLASFVGLTLDRRLTVEQRRALIAEANTLFRIRGTVAGLSRMIELATDARPVILYVPSDSENIFFEIPATIIEAPASAWLLFSSVIFPDRIPVWAIEVNDTNKNRSNSL
ncbi:MAG: Phage tail protein (Tail_P2_I) [Firmicutes bacterium ADurb.Bin373]|nr:MAG: Phage tail protein (Tail_P2_I) [Firmicutes bacterium ADurb.Bin373]